MPDSIEFIPRILVLGRLPSVWAEPLATWVELEQIRIDVVATVYEAAASIRGAMVLLINGESVRRGDLERLQLFDSSGVRRFLMRGFERDVKRYGVGSWEEAMEFFAGMLEGVEERIVVTANVAERYDEMAEHPLISEEEMQALLGAAE